MPFWQNKEELIRNEVWDFARPVSVPNSKNTIHELLRRLVYNNTSRKITGNVIIVNKTQGYFLMSQHAIKMTCWAWFTHIELPLNNLYY